MDEPYQGLYRWRENFGRQYASARGRNAGGFEEGESMRKLTLSLSDKEYELIERLAKEDDKGKTDVIRAALKMRDYLETKAAEGTEVMLRRGDKELTVLPIELFR